MSAYIVFPHSNAIHCTPTDVVCFKLLLILNKKKNHLKQLRVDPRATKPYHVIFVGCLCC
jgi:hypothetical protein